MSWVSQIIKSALEGDAVEMKTAFEKEMEERISDKMDDLYQEAADDLFAESEELDESTIVKSFNDYMKRYGGNHPNKVADTFDDYFDSSNDPMSNDLRHIMIYAAKFPKNKDVDKLLTLKGLKKYFIMKEDQELDERKKGAPKMGPDPFRSMTAGGEKDRKSAAQKGSKWRVTFKTGHEAVDVTARNTSEAIKKGIASADKQDVQGSPAYKDVKKISEEVDLDETSYEKDLDPNKKIKVTGVKGMNSKPFTKKFKNQKALDKWLDSDEASDYEINQIMNEEDLDEAKMSDGEVLAAAKKLGKNAKDAKTKEFAYGLVDYYNEHESFSPEQVGALQNIMKKASFQMAEK